MQCTPASDGTHINVGRRRADCHGGPDAFTVTRRNKKIETESYQVFNRSIEDENLAIICYDYIPTGSNIKAEACEPQFVTDKRGNNANDARLGYDLLLTPTDLQSVLAAEYNALNAAMSELSAQSEYCRELNSILSALREELASR